ARNLVTRRDTGGPLNFSRNAKGCELGDEIIPHAIVFSGANRMWRGRKGVQINERALRGKSFLCCACGYRIRCPFANRTHARDKQHEQKNDPATETIFHGTYPRRISEAPILVVAVAKGKLRF